MVDVSIIVPIYNVEKYLKKCIDGILNQTHKNFELILVNDGSPDNCGHICEEYKKLNNRIKVIHQKNQGTGIARNSGLAIASGKYIYFCDPDDFIEPNLIKDNFQIAMKNNANMVVFGFYDELYTKHGQKTIPRTIEETIFLESKQDFRNKFDKLHKKNVMYTLWNKLYKREFLDKNKCFFGNQKVGQDTIFNYLVYENLDRVFINDKNYYHYVLGRLDSAVNFYRENRFNIRYDETLKFENLIEKWGYTEKFNEIIVNEWMTTLHIGLNNLFYYKCPLNDQEKKKQIASFIDTPKIKILLKNISLKQVDSLFMKFEIFLLKNKNVTLALYSLKLKEVVKNILINKL